MPWAFGGTRMELDHSLTHSLTHSILINLFIKVTLTLYSHLLYLVLLLFQVPFTNMFGIF